MLEDPPSRLRSPLHNLRLVSSRLLRLVPISCPSRLHHLRLVNPRLTRLVILAPSRPPGPRHITVHRASWPHDRRTPCSCVWRAPASPRAHATPPSPAASHLPLPRISCAGTSGLAVEAVRDLAAVRSLQRSCCLLYACLYSVV